MKHHRPLKEEAEEEEEEEKCTTYRVMLCHRTQGPTVRKVEVRAGRRGFSHPPIHSVTEHWSEPPLTHLCHFCSTPLLSLVTGRLDLPLHPLISPPSPISPHPPPSPSFFHSSPDRDGCNQCTTSFPPARPVPWQPATVGLILHYGSNDTQLSIRGPEPKWRPPRRVTGPFRSAGLV